MKRADFCALLLCLLMLGFGFNQGRVLAAECNGLSIVDCLKKGVSYQKSNDLYRAGVTFREAVAKDPNNPAATFFLGRYFAFGNETDKGIEYLTKTINNSRNSKLTANAYLYRGLIFYNDGKFGPAEKDFTKSIEYNPQRADAYWYRYLCLKGGKGPQQYRNISAEKKDVETAANLGHQEAKKELSQIEQIQADNKKMREEYEKEERKRKEAAQASLSQTQKDLDYVIKNLKKIITGLNGEITNPGKVDELRLTMLAGNGAHRVLIGSYLSCLYQDAAKCATVDSQYREQISYANICQGAAKEQLMYAPKKIQADLVKLYQAVPNEYYKSPSRLKCVNKARR